MNKKEELFINIDIEHINNEKFNTKKIPGLHYLPLRHNLIRYLFIAYKLYKLINDNINDSHIKFNYPPNLSRRQLIYWKIYDMSGLTADNKFIWYENFFTQFHNQDIVIDEDFGVYSRFKIEEAKMIIYINTVVDLWFFLLDGVRNVEQSLSEYIIRNCLTYEQTLEVNKKSITNIDMYIKIDEVVRYDENIIEHLISNYEKNNNWSKLRNISLSTAWDMHCDLLEQFTSIINKIKNPIETIPRDAKFYSYLSPDYVVTKMVAYLSQKRENITIWKN